MAKLRYICKCSGEGFLLDVQSDLLSGLNTRVVVPLIEKAQAPKPAKYLNPVLNISGIEVVMATQYLAAVPEQELANYIETIEIPHEITAALDMLFSGF